jgi:hypothetical protein
MGLAMTSVEPSIRFREAVRAFATQDSVEDAPPQPARELSEVAREVASHFSDRPISPNLLYGWVRLGDLGIVLASGLVIAGLQNSSLIDRYTLGLTTLGAVMAVLVNQAVDSYQISSLKSVFATIARVFGAWTIVALALGAILLATSGLDAHRLAWMFSWYAGALGLLMTMRVMLSGFVRSDAPSSSVAARRRPNSSSRSKHSAIPTSASAASLMIGPMTARRRSCAATPSSVISPISWNSAGSPCSTC